MPRNDGLPAGTLAMLAAPAVSGTGRQVRGYRITPAGRRQLEAERARHRQVVRAIAAVIDTP